MTFERVEPRLPEGADRGEPGVDVLERTRVERVHALLRARSAGASDEDIIATAVQVTAESVGDAYRRFIPEPVREVLVSGGGAKNPALFAAMKKAAEPVKVRHFEEVYFDGEAKEAVAAGMLPELDPPVTIACVIDPAISPGIEKIVPNFELRPAGAKAEKPTDVEIAAARNLAADLYSARIIDYEAEKRISAHFRPPEPKN